MLQGTDIKSNKTHYEIFTTQCLFWITNSQQFHKFQIPEHPFYSRFYSQFTLIKVVFAKLMSQQIAIIRNKHNSKLVNKSIICIQNVITLNSSKTFFKKISVQQCRKHDELAKKFAIFHITNKFFQITKINEN